MDSMVVFVQQGGIGEPWHPVSSVCVPLHLERPCSRPGSAALGLGWARWHLLVSLASGEWWAHEPGSIITLHWWCGLLSPHNGNAGQATPQMGFCRTSELKTEARSSHFQPLEDNAACQEERLSGTLANWSERRGRGLAEEAYLSSLQDGLCSVQPVLSPFTPQMKKRKGQQYWDPGILEKPLFMPFHLSLKPGLELPRMPVMGQWSWDARSYLWGGGSSR